MNVNSTVHVYLTCPRVPCADVQSSHEIWQEEVFGPVMAVKTFKTEEEAVELANGTKYGLASAVFSSDDAQLARVTSRLRTGIVWQNCSQVRWFVVQNSWSCADRRLLLTVSMGIFSFALAISHVSVRRHGVASSVVALAAIWARRAFKPTWSPSRSCSKSTLRRA